MRSEQPAARGTIATRTLQNPLAAHHIARPASPHCCRCIRRFLQGRPYLHGMRSASVVDYLELSEPPRHAG